MTDPPWNICDRHGFSTPLEELDECPDCYVRPDIYADLARPRVHHHRSLRVPAGVPDYIGLEPLVNITIRPGIEVTYDGRPAVVCVPPLKGDRLGYSLHDDVLIRYLDGKRERVLVNPYDCAVGIDR